MKRLFIFIILFAVLLLDTACSIQASLKKRGGEGSTTASYSNQLEAVPGTTQTAYVGGYQVQTTVGHYLKDIKQSASGGYTVYSTVQGNMISE